MMNKIGNITVILLTFILVSFCYTKTYSQEEKRNRLFDFSIDITHNEGRLLQNLRYEIYPNIGIKLFRLKNFELHAKIGHGLIALFGNPELMSYQVSLESYFNIGKHSIVSGLGFLRGKKFGTYVPFICGYRYSVNLKNSFMVQVNPNLWMTYKVYDDDGIIKQRYKKVWEDFSFTGYTIKFGYYLHF